MGNIGVVHTTNYDLSQLSHSVPTFHWVPDPQFPDTPLATERGAARIRTCPGRAVWYGTLMALGGESALGVPCQSHDQATCHRPCRTTFAGQRLSDEDLASSCGRGLISSQPVSAKTGQEPGSPGVGPEIRKFAGSDWESTRQMVVAYPPRCVKVAPFRIPRSAKIAGRQTDTGGINAGGRHLP